MTKNATILPIFLLYELLHQQICGFLELFRAEMHLTLCARENRALAFFVFKYFSNNLLLIGFVQKMVTTFVKILQQKNE